MPDRPSAPKAILGLVTGTFAIGFSAIWVRLSGVGPLSTAFWRVGLATLFLLIWIMIYERPQLLETLKPQHRKWFWSTVLAGLAFSGDLAVWHISIHHTTVAMATLLANFAPLLMLIGAILFLNEKVSQRGLVGISLCFAGVFCLAQKPSLHGQTQTVLGNALALGAAFFYALYLILLRRSKNPSATPMIALAIASIAGSVVLLPLGLIFEPRHFLPHTLFSALILLLLGGTAQVMGQGLIVAYFPQVSGELSSAILCLQSVFAAGAGYLLLGETLAVFQIVGGLLVLMGIFFVKKAKPL